MSRQPNETEAVENSENSNNPHPDAGGYVSASNLADECRFAECVEAATVTRDHPSGETVQVCETCAKLWGSDE
jgi:hypothetical protein